MKMTLETIPDIARSLLEKAIDIQTDESTLITLEGDLGAGKTTLTQQIARELGVKANLISPTFVIMKKYDLPEQAGARHKKFKYLVHIDVYRLSKSEELLKLGWLEIVKEKDTLIILEWPENVPECIPTNALKVKLTHQDDTTRAIEF